VTTSRNLAGWLAVLFCAFVLAAMAGKLIAIAPFSLPDYLGTDTYARMVRVRDLWAGGPWFDPVYTRILPDGLVSHWTRPLDVLISLCALPFLPFMARETALFWGGYLVSPVLGVVTAVVLMLALRRMFTPLQTAMSVALLVCTVPILGTFFPGRPDHYSALLPVMGLILWGLVLLFTTEHWRRGALLVGICLPLALWVNMSGALVSLVVPVALGIRWLVSGGGWTRTNQWIGTAAAVTCLGVLFIERSPSTALTVVEFDRISVWHLCVFATIALFWTVLQRLEDRRPALTVGPMRRMVAALPFGVIGIGALLLAFPQVLGPHQGIPVDPLYARMRLAHIEEYLPLIDATSLESLSTFMTALGTSAASILPLILGIAGAAVLLVVGPSDRRWLWGSVLFVSLACTALTWPPVLAWMPMILLLLLPGYGALAAMVVEAPARLPRLARVPIRTALVLGVMVGPILVQVVSRTTQGPEDQNILEGCTFGALARWLDEALPPSPPLNIMAVADMGGELMYRTPHNVYAIANHRLQPGFATRWSVVSAPDAETARTRVAAADVDVLVLCSAVRQMDPLNPSDPPAPFKASVLAGAVPPWLEPIPTPETISEAVRVFRVRLDRD